MISTSPTRALDFTSALYLGLWHPSWAVPRWSRLTLGAPAALREPPAAILVARELAELTGCPRATLATSTLHIFWDLFVGLVDRPAAIYMDDDVYPIARWGIERAAARGVAVHRFPHHNADRLRRDLARWGSGRGKPLVVTDGFCPRCGRSAPLAAYIEAARRWGGAIVVDDTQALGILGREPGPAAPYGLGGGGSLPHFRLSGPDVILVASLAKGLGVPLAMLAGARHTVERFEALSATRVHCTPPSVATLHAARYALAVNRHRGDSLRARLASLVDHLHLRLGLAGLRTIGGPFPVQTLMGVRGDLAVRFHQALMDRQIWTVLGQGHGEAAPRIAILVTSRHTRQDIAGLVLALERVAEAKLGNAHGYLQRTS